MNKAVLVTGLLALASVSGCSKISDIAQRFNQSNIHSNAPFLYVSSYNYTGNLLNCLDNAQEALRKNGFSENVSRDGKEKWGTVRADNPNGLVAAIIECDAAEERTPSTTLAVSSDNNDKAYAGYQKLSDAEW